MYQRGTVATESALFDTSRKTDQEHIATLRRACLLADPNHTKTAHISSRNGSEMIKRVACEHTTMWGRVLGNLGAPTLNGLTERRLGVRQPLTHVDDGERQNASERKAAGDI